MYRLNQKTVWSSCGSVVLLLAIASAYVSADPPDCSQYTNCPKRRAASGLHSCTQLTGDNKLCTQLTPAGQTVCENCGKVGFTCWRVMDDWPTDCVDTQSSDTNGGCTRCNSPSTNCRIQTSCEWNATTSTCVVKANSDTGAWSNENKPTTVNCDKAG